MSFHSGKYQFTWNYFDYSFYQSAVRLPWKFELSQPKEGSAQEIAKVKVVGNTEKWKFLPKWRTMDEDCDNDDRGSTRAKKKDELELFNERIKEGKCKPKIELNNIFIQL